MRYAATRPSSRYRPPWTPGDRIVLALNTALLVLVALFAVRFDHVVSYLAFHALVGVAFVAAARRDDGSPTRRFVHAWLPLIFMIAVYFELSLVVPRIHPFTDHFPYDYALQAIDRRVLGDPAAFIAHLAWPPLSDLLTVCYWLYYPFGLALPMLTYARGGDDLRDFHHVATVLLYGFIVCFIGYLTVPALGPHKLFDVTRAAALDGYGLAERGYAMMSRVPHEPPDAFPSGHAMMAMLVPMLAWRHARSLFWWLVAVGVGIVLATVYLRFHYLSDVVASFLLAPVAYWLGSVTVRDERLRARSGHSGAGGAGGGGDRGVVRA
jgi:membrane-associated phospholipid phosphatase